MGDVTMAEARSTTTTQAADPLQAHMDAADRLARLVAQDDDERFMLVFQSLVNVVDSFVARPTPNGGEQARSILLRMAEPMTTRGRRGLIAVAPAAPALPQSQSIFTDPVFQANSKKMIRDRKRIVGGIPTSAFPDCVAIGSNNDWCCTGTLVAPNVVITAAHCLPVECANRIFIGEDVNVPGNGRVIEVKTAVIHPDYLPLKRTQDIAVLILEEDAAVAPRAIATAAVVNKATTVRLAGFGNTDVFSSGGYGRRRMVDVPVASSNPDFGADPKTEFVAGAPFLDRDSCNGDSGGPAFVQSGQKWFLAGATSRATASSIRPCGDGGIYTRIHAFLSWVRSVPGGHWS
jgi:hypothetical protein